MKRSDTKVSPKIFVVAFFITLFLFISILIVGDVIGKQREDYINTEVELLYSNLNRMQTYMLMSETYGERMACLASREQLKELDQSIWTLGQKIDQYRIATEEFSEDEYYKTQKTIFNENEVYYLMLLTQLKKQCDLNHTIVAFFYGDSKECPSCDSQSFVLADINREVEERVSIFYFDTNLNLSSVELLEEYYNLSGLPCVVIDDEPECGMQDKARVMERICETGVNIPPCWLKK